jgi:hypothetical protein
LYDIGIFFSGFVFLAFLISSFVALVTRNHYLDSSLVILGTTLGYIVAMIYSSTWYSSPSLDSIFFLVLILIGIPISIIVSKLAIHLTPVFAVISSIAVSYVIVFSQAFGFESVLSFLPNLVGLTIIAVDIPFIPFLLMVAIVLTILFMRPRICFSGFRLVYMGKLTKAAHVITESNLFFFALLFFAINFAYIFSFVVVLASYIAYLGFLAYIHMLYFQT